MRKFSIGVGRAALPLPLPPNRTGGFPASGFPVSGVSARLTISARAVFQTKQPSRRKPSVGPPSAVGLTQPVAGPLLPFAQHRPQASAQPAVRAAQARAMACSEVAVPAPQDRIYLRNGLAQASSVGAPRQRSHFLLQFLKALLARPFLPSAKVPAQKVETFTDRVDDARFGWVQAQPCPRRPFAQKRQHCFGFFFGVAQHDEVVRVAHHRPAPPRHLVVQRVEVEVCQKRTDHGPLRGATFRRLPALQFFQHAGFQTLFQQRQDAAVHDSLLDQRHQPIMRNGIEVALEVGIHTPDLTLVQELLHAIHCLPTAPAGPKPVAVLGEIALKDRFEYVPHSRLDGPVAHRGNSQRSLLVRPRFLYPDATRRLAAVAFSAQFFAQPRQLALDMLVKLLDGLAIDSGCSLVAPDRPKAGLKVVLREHFVPEPEPYGCRLTCFEPGQHAIGPHRMFHPPPAVAGFCGLLRLVEPSHYRRSIGFVIRHRLLASTFLRPLAPRALPRFLATTDALTPAGRLFGRTGHEHRSGPDGSPCLPRSHFQPFCPQPPRRPSHGICSRSRFCSARGRWPEDPALERGQREKFPWRSWRGLRTALAGSPVGVAESGLRCVMFDMSRYYGRVVHLRQLPTSCRHDAVAFGYRRVNA